MLQNAARKYARQLQWQQKAERAQVGAELAGRRRWLLWHASCALCAVRPGPLLPRLLRSAGFHTPLPRAKNPQAVGGEEGLGEELLEEMEAAERKDRCAGAACYDPRQPGMQAMGGPLLCCWCTKRLAASQQLVRAARRDCSTRAWGQAAAACARSPSCRYIDQILRKRAGRPLGMAPRGRKAAAPAAAAGLAQQVRPPPYPSLFRCNSVLDVMAAPVTAAGCASVGRSSWHATSRD